MLQFELLFIFIPTTYHVLIVYLSVHMFLLFVKCPFLLFMMHMFLFSGHCFFILCACYAKVNSFHIHYGLFCFSPF